MASREPGTCCKLRAEWLDADPPVEGDFLRTDAGTCYRIDSFTQSSGRRSNYVLRCTRLGKDAVQFGDPGVGKWSWHRRSRRSP